jgi:cytochrome b subunit of formate dehydrogenase
MANKIDPIEKTIPPQEWTKYNRESGKKTLYFVGVTITLIVALAGTILWLLFKS